MTNEWIKISDLKQLLFTHDGRLNRKPFIIIVVIIALLQYLLSYFGLIFLDKFFGMALTVCPTIKRFHDRGYSGWWWVYSGIGLIMTALFAFISIGAINEEVIAENPTVYDKISTILLLLTGLISTGACISLIAWLVIELYFLRGTKGTNEYGPDPLEENASTNTVAS